MADPPRSLATRIVCSLQVASLLLLAAASLGAAPPPEGTGRVNTSIRLADLDARAVPRVGDTGAGLGVLDLRATTLEGPLARAGLAGGEVAGQDLPAWEATSQGGPERGEVGVPVPDGPVTGTVRILDYRAEAADGTARARLGALTGSLQAGPLGLGVGLGDRGIETTVTPTAATGTTHLRLPGIRLGVADLLPADLRAGLPLGVVVELVRGLDLDLPADLAGAVTTLEDLERALTEVADLSDQLAGAESELAGLLTDPAVQAARQAVADAEEALAAAESDLRVAEEELAASIAARDEAQAAVDADSAEVAAAREKLEAAQAEVDRLEGELAAIDSRLSTLGSDESLAESLTTQTDIDTLLDGLQHLEDTYGDDAGCTSLDSLVLTSVTMETLQDIAACYETYLEGAIADLEADRQVVESDLADAAAVRDTAQQTLDEAQATLEAAQADLAAAQEEVQAARQAVGDAEQAVAEAQAALDQARANLSAALEAAGDAPAVRDLEDRIRALRARVQGLLEQVGGMLDGLPDLEVLRKDLLGALADTPLIDTGEVLLAVSVRADGARGAVEVACRLAGASVVDRDLEARPCDRLDAVVQELAGTVGSLLGSLPAGTVPAVSLAGPSISTEASPRPDADGRTHAAVRATGLKVAIPSVALTGLAGQLTARLQDLLAEAETALARASGQSPTLGGLTRQQVNSDGLASALGGLEAQLTGLPTGKGLDGLRTTGLSAKLGTLTSTAAFVTPAPAGQPTDAAPGGGAGKTPDAAPDPAPAGPGDAPDAAPDGPDRETPAPPPEETPRLPRTGGHRGLLLLAALSLLTSGGLALALHGRPPARVRSHTPGAG